jgi:BlaI family transcriptional regulator, penicillinase repressor
MPKHMLRQPRPPRPTNAELQILRVLWQRGPSTVRDVHDALDSRKLVGYTTVLKLLQIMTEKNLVTRELDQIRKLLDEKKTGER